MGVPIGLATLTALGYVVFAKAATSPAIRVLLSLGAFILVSQWVLSGWDRLRADEQAQALQRWQELTKRLWRSRALGLWPVLLVVLTALVGFTDWFPAGGSGRLMMLASIATVAIYGYFREKAEKRKDLLAFADEARDRFAEAAKQIHEERNREIEERERSARINRLISDLEDRFSQLKGQAEFLRVPFRDLVDTSELRGQLSTAGFSPTDEEFYYILSELGLGD
ncbi:MAG: hypothetical protein ACODUE_05025 [Synechococcus sp.]